MEVFPRCLAAGPASKAIARIHEKTSDAVGLLHDCAEKLPSMLRRAGFSSVRAEIRLGPVGDVLGEDGRNGKIAVMGSIRSMRKAFVRAGLVESEEALAKLLEDMVREWEDVGGVYAAYLYVVAQKPQSKL